MVGVRGAKVDAEMRLRLAHLVSLEEIGGISRDYVDFVVASRRLGLARNHTLLLQRRIAAPLRRLLQAGSEATRSADRLGGLRLPKLLRRPYLGWMLGRMRADAVLLWSAPSTAALVPPQVAGVYYEHGAAWFGESIGRARPQLDRLAGVICNSRAAKRMLELRWGLGGEQVRVCLNGVRPSCRPEHPASRTIVADQPVRLGAAGRLEPIKGFPLAIHALAHLLRDGIPATLALAGTGLEARSLAALADRLGVSHAVRFLGLVDDMRDFYDSLHLFLCPSLREPFGLVAAEALAHGVPVIAAAVDGLPEVVSHGETGLCLKPRLTLEAYRALGGATHTLPPLVYDPASDGVVSPGAVDPVDLAKAVVDLLREPQRYAAMSALGPATVAQRFDYDRHVRDVLSNVAELCDRSGTGRKAPSRKGHPTAES